VGDGVVIKKMVVAQQPVIAVRVLRVRMMEVTPLPPSAP